MAKQIPIFLQMPHQQGGMRFGPFTQRIDVGSDPKGNQIVLDARQGIFPSHAVAMQVDTGVLQLQPAGPQCQVFVIPYGQQQTWPVRGPVQVKNGDMMIFGTPGGPTFQVQADMSHLKSADQVLAEAKAKGGEAGAMHALSAFVDRLFGPPKATGIAGEIQRQGQAQLLRTGAGSAAYNLSSRAKSGVLTSPRTLVGLAVALFGLVTTGGVTCSGLLFTFYRVVLQ